MLESEKADMDVLLTDNSLEAIEDAISAMRAEAARQGIGEDRLVKGTVALYQRFDLSGNPWALSMTVL